jgi:hypothetical protein
MANALSQNMEMMNVLQGSTGANAHIKSRDFCLQEQEKEHQQVKDQIPPNGCTLKSYLILTGSNIFSDASWKMKKAPGLGSATATGIGVYCQIQESSSTATVLI